MAESQEEKEKPNDPISLFEVIIVGAGLALFIYALYSGIPKLLQ